MPDQAEATKDDPNAGKDAPAQGQVNGEANDEPHGKQDQGNGKKRSKWSRLRTWLLAGFTVLILVLGGLYAAYYFLIGRYYLSTDDAYVQGNKIQLMSQIDGTVIAITAEDTDLVKQGQLLVQLDDTDAKLALDHAKAQLAQNVRQVQTLFQTAKQQQAQVQLQKAQLDLAQKNYSRDQFLLKKNAITPKIFDEQATQVQAAKANLAMARHQLAGIQAKIAHTTVRTNPHVKLAEAELRQAYLTLQKTRIVAPATGYVAMRAVQVGEQVKPGTPMMAIVPLKQIWIDANYKETDLAGVRIGQPVTLTADLYGEGVKYHGKVAGLSAGTGAAFELLPPQNATGNWIKVVRRLPVRVTLDMNELQQHPLYLGLSMRVTINIHHQSGPRLAGPAQPGEGYHTDVFQDRLRGVKALIQKIIQANLVSGPTPAKH